MGLAMTCFPCHCGKRVNSSIDLANIDGVENVNFYTYKELRTATNKFSRNNKIGEGGFGSVFKGKLKDGTIVAIKVLSPESKQGLQEFLTELTVLANIQHENLVEMLGCCVEGNNRILIFRYLENNSLAQTLLGQNRNNIDFSWTIRRRICVGIATGLAFLHEEVQPHIIHRDVKPSNILLDKDLTAKVCGFGLAELIPANMTHDSIDYTDIAGTVGYIAPEYALRGQLTRKADIYSFGVLLMEIVCGRCNKNRRLPVGEQYLLQRAWAMLEKESLIELVDEAFKEDLDIKEAECFLKIALLCTQEMPNLRPTMSTVVRMLQGEENVFDTNMTPPGILSDITEVETKENCENKNSKNSSPIFSPQLGSSSLQSEQTDPTCAILTFTSRSARNN